MTDVDTRDDASHKASTNNRYLVKFCIYGSWVSNHHKITARFYAVESLVLPRRAPAMSMERDVTKDGPGPISERAIFGRSSRLWMDQTCQRDCSLQRRHQKIVEEAPVPGIADALRQQIREAAGTLARGMNYGSAGTVEFVYDEDTKTFYFLEMNTRIQVGHPVTEAITWIDRVQQQLRVASGQSLNIAQSEVTFRGHAIECRITAELPYENFRPGPGRITAWLPPRDEFIRLDTHCFDGYTVPLHYDFTLGEADSLW